MDYQETLSSALKMPCQEERHIPPGSACSVYVNHIDSDGSLWVMLESEFRIMEVISDALNENVLLSVGKFEVNDVVCALNLDDTWYRAMILSVEPSICVRFIDFGDKLTTSVERLALLPPTLSVLRPLAMKVKLPSESKIKPVVSASLLVECIGSDEGVAVVDAVVPKSENMAPDFTQRLAKNPDQLEASTIQIDDSKLVHPDESQLVHPDESQLVHLDESPLKSPNMNIESFRSDQVLVECPLPPETVPQKSPKCYNEPTAIEQSAVNDSLPSDPASLKSPESLIEPINSEQSAGNDLLQPDTSTLKSPGGHDELETNQQAAVDNSLPLNSPAPKSPDTVIESVKCEEAVGDISLPLTSLEVSCEQPALTTCIPESGVQNEGTPSESASFPNNLTTESFEQDVLCVSKPEFFAIPCAPPLESAVKLGASEKATEAFSEALAPDDVEGRESSLNGERDLLTARPHELPRVVESVETMSTPSAPRNTLELPSEDRVLPVSVSQVGKSLVKEWIQGPIRNGASDVKRSGSQAHNFEAPMKNTESATVPFKGNHFRRKYTEDRADDSFTSACGQFPHQGGYGPTGYVDFGGSGDNKHASYQGHAPRSITKGRKTSPQPLLCQEMPQSNALPVPPKSDLQASIAKLASLNFSNCPPDFKTVLDLELSIIREQNRLQMLQLQKKMEHNLSCHVKIMKEEMNNVKEEMNRQLSTFRNEVQNRLLILNDSVVHKMADIYSDITMLKNDKEMAGLPQSSGAPDVNSVQMHQYQNSHSAHNMQPQSTPYNRPEGSSDTRPNNRFNLKGYKKDDNPQGNSCNMSKFPYNSQKQYPKQPVNSYDRKADANAVGPGARLRSVLLEEGDRNKEMPHHYQAALMNEGNESNHPDQQQSFSVGQFNVNNYPKMDYFDPSKAGGEKDAEASGNKSAAGSIICVNNLTEKINPDLLFSLFGVYGSVLRVKISQQDKGRAFIEMGDSAQADEAVRYLNNAPLMGQRLHVAPSNFEKLNLSRQEFQSNTCKDFTKPNLVKLNRFKFVKWDAQKLFAPSQRLMITNVLSSISDEKIKEEFAKRGFHIQNISNQPCSNDEKKLVFATLGSVEEAVNALTVMHLQELSDWMMMRISFAKADKR